MATKSQEKWKGIWEDDEEDVGGGEKERQNDAKEQEAKLKESVCLAK